MFESILNQELMLPPTGLSELGDHVPLPRFVEYSQSNTASIPKSNQVDESFYHYHFLAQIAHRIILSRIRHTLFFSSKWMSALLLFENITHHLGDSFDYPHPPLAEELDHQLAQWRENLPVALHFDENTLPEKFSSPEQELVDALLLSRYRVARFHIGRPFL
jgi:hypothetical protein